MTEEKTDMYTFDTPRPVDLKVELSSGSVEISTSDDTQSTVELVAIHDDSHAKELIDNARVEQRGDTIAVLLPKSKGSFFGRKGEIRATITIPHESSMKVETASADVKASGRFGQSGVTSGSGDVELEQVASADIKVGSGDIELTRALGSIKTKSGSGDVEVGSVAGAADVIVGSGDAVIGSVIGVLKVKSGSGDVVVKSGGEKVDVMSGSGDVLVRRIDRGSVSVKTGSGDTTVGVASGTAAYLDIQTISGDVKSDLDSAGGPADNDLQVSINVISASGDVVLHRA
jgi:hypothetical protein